nr:glycosyltransferase family 39 protein [candidate division Zixibacteria bacterium]
MQVRTSLQINLFVVLKLIVDYFGDMKRLAGLLKKHPIILILILAGLIRLIFLMEYYNSPEWNQLVVDSLFHHRWAISIAFGNIIGDQVFFRAPFYIYILGLIYAIAGPSLLAARIFGHLVGLISVFLTYLIGRRLFNRPVGLMAALIHALYPIAIFFESELLVDNLFTLFFELSILILISSPKNKKYHHYVFLGLILGFAAITRPLILGLIPLYLIWIILDSKNIRSVLLGIAITFLLMIVVIAPITIRNKIVGNDFVLISSSGGINFYIGNNASSDGLTASLPPPYGNSWQISDINYLAEKETGRSLKPSGVSAFWTSKAIDWITHNKIDFIKLYAKKLYYCMNDFEVSNNKNISAFFDGFLILRIIPLNYGFILSLAAAGIIFLFALGGIMPQIKMVFLLIVGYFLLISLFFINARFRLPVIPLIIIFGGVGLESIFASIKHRSNLKYPAIAVTAAIIAFTLSQTNFYRMRHDSRAGGAFSKGNYYLALGDMERAVDYYRMTLSDDPRYPDANLNLGAAFLKTGRGDSAEFYLRRELELEPGNARAFADLASLYFTRHDYDNAGRMAERAISLKPYFDDPYLILLRLSAVVNDTLLFNRTLERINRIPESHTEVDLEAGLVLSQWKDFDRAIDYLNHVMETGEPAIETDDRAFGYSPDGNRTILKLKARAAYQLGYIYGLQNRLDLSLEKSRLAIALDSNLAEAYINLYNAFLMTGRRDQALDIIHIARNKFPDNEIIRAIINQQP